jgi:hypothetical protein
MIHADPLHYYPTQGNRNFGYIEKRARGKICPVDEKVAKMVVPIGTYLHGTWS